MEFSLGTELAGAGLGLDISGAVFLGMGLLDSSFGIASLLHIASRRTSGSSDSGNMSELSIQDAARSRLRGEVGVGLLCAGFACQVAGLIWQGGLAIPGLPFIAAATAAVASAVVSRKYVDRVLPALVEEIIHSARGDVRFNIDDARQQPRKYQWTETRFVVLLRHLYG